MESISNTADRNNVSASANNAADANDVTENHVTAQSKIEQFWTYDRAEIGLGNPLEKLLVVWQPLASDFVLV